MRFLLQAAFILFIFYTLCMISIALVCLRKVNQVMLDNVQNILDELFRATTPNLANRSTTDCEYNEILTSTECSDNWDVNTLINFSYAGIVNGTYVPEHCNPAFSVAILVTYRHRESNLMLFKMYIHNFLRKQNIHYRMYLIQQIDGKVWNKGLLYNIGARQAIADEFPCLILHDVDLLPLTENNLYACTYQPRHMSSSVDKLGFKLPYVELVGGVLAIRSEQYLAVNGFSNRFYGWGGEDDDFWERLNVQGIQIMRFSQSRSRYKMLNHRDGYANYDRYRVLKENRHQHISGEGLSSIKYTSIEIKRKKLFTWIQVET